MKKRIACILICWNILLSLGLGGSIYSLQECKSANRQMFTQSLAESEEESQIMYLLFIGLNDKDTYQQIIPTKKAKQIIEEICGRYTDGYTCMEAYGSWVDEKGRRTIENTMICQFADIRKEQLQKIMDELLTALNQNSILVEKRNADVSFYYGSDDREENDVKNGK